MKQRSYLVAAAAAALILVSIAAYRYSGGREETKLREEPTLSLYVVDSQEKQTLKIEEYIEGVVAGEMKPNWPENAYAAQAILARSFTMNWLEAGKKSRYGTDLSTDVKEAQAYEPRAVTSTIQSAVRRTRGKVMVYDGKYVKGWFHSYSGGRTATAKEGLNYPGEEPPYIRSVELPENEYVPAELKAWSVQLSEEQVAAALADLGKTVGAIRTVQIGRKGPSGRAVTLVFRGSEGEAEVSAPEFRTAVGPNEMKSTLLTEASWEAGRLLLRGSGFGHGVGLSQWDAYMFARQGDSPEEIVRRFFPEVSIERRW